MHESNLQTKSEIYKQRNIKEGHNNMNSQPINIVNQETEQSEQSSYANIHQKENFVVNIINPLTKDQIRENIQNYSLTDNRIRYPAPLPFVAKKNTFYQSVNPNKNYNMKGIIIPENVIIKTDINDVQIQNNNPPPQYSEETEEESKNDICCCILIILYYLALFPFIISCVMILYCIYYGTKDESIHECIILCVKGLCICGRRRR